MKRFLFLCLTALTLQATCFAYDAEIDGIYYNLDSSSQTATVTYLYSNNSNSSAYTGSVDIPETVT